jgi:hypothetical protein
MLHRLAAGLVLALTIALTTAPAGAGTAETPELTDPAGDANFVSALAGDQRDTRPASFDNVDIRAVWFETEYSKTKIADQASGAVLRVEHRPTALVVHIQTTAPVHPTSPFSAARYKVQATVPACTASFELRTYTNAANAAAEIWPVGTNAACGGLPPLSGVVSPVKPTIEGTVATLTFPLSHEKVREVIAAGNVLSQPAAHVTVSAGTPAQTVDTTAAGPNFAIGQDVPADIDCAATPGHADCQP